MLRVFGLIGRYFMLMGEGLFPSGEGRDLPSADHL